MIQKALQYLVGLGEAKEHTIHGDTYSDKELYRVDKLLRMAAPIEMNILTSLVDYIKAHIDTMAEKMIIQVVSPEEVRLFSQLNEKRCRETIVKVEALIPSFRYEHFIDHESFCISVQAKFMDDPATDKALLLKFAGTVEQGSVAEYGDDGVTQKATVRQGIASKTDAVVPNPVKLRPYRTFTEVVQPASDFIFRMKEDRGITCALFEADGGAWKNAAMKNIKEYLEFELEGYQDQFIVIS
ncbi:hypothetical protein [Suilimivivens sp.]|uniref:hypothetical protein n=1 Tax=Suilimivivens sp. TaxID=2981669 RepID=UPI00307C5D8C